MNESQPFTYRNPIQRLIRIFLWLAAALTVVGVPALLGTIHLNTPATRDGGLAVACLVVTAISLPGAAAMLLAGLLTIPNARKADRLFESFRQHDCLAEWTYTDAEWRRYVVSEEARVRKAAWVISSFVGVIVLALWLFTAWAATSDWHSRLIGMAFAVAATALVVGIIVGSYFLYIHMRRRRLISCPRAFLGKNAIFCGGDFGYWGSNMLELRSARLLEGDVPQLEFVVGTGGTGQNIARVADAVNLLAGHPSGASQMTWRYTVLVPEGRLAEAQKALQTMREPLVAKAFRPAMHVATPHATTSVPVTRSQIVAEAQTTPAKKPSGSRLWWWATAGLFVVGLGLMMSADTAGKAHTAVAVTGFFMWCAAPITLIVAIVMTIKGRRSRTST